MKGVLKTKSAGSQFLVLVGITLVSLFVIGFVGTLLLASFSGNGLKELTNITKMDLSKPGTLSFVRGMQIVQFFAFFLVPSLICAYLFSNEPKKYLGFKKPWNGGYYVTGVGIMLLAIPIAFVLGKLNQSINLPDGIENWMKEKENEVAGTIEALLRRRTLTDLVLNILCIAGVAAVGEELLFRGIAQRLLIKMFKSPWVGIIISATLFSAMHIQFYGFLPRLALGILLGLIYWYSGSLWPAIVAHFLYDTLAIIMAYYFPETLNDQSTPQLTGFLMICIACSALLILTLVWMKRKSQTTFAGVYAEDAIPVKDHPF